MPNYVTNKVSLQGNHDDLVKAINSFSSEEQWGLIDFNKVIPMPESLNMEAGSRTDTGYTAYCDFIEVYTLSGILKQDLLNIPEEREKAFLEFRSDIKQDEWELGKAAFQNKQRYGAKTWYEWCIENWGTKWNAVDAASSGFSGNEYAICFLSAWSAPIPVIQRISEINPDIEVTIRWADEDIGSNCGKYVFRGGEITEEYYPESKVEAIAYGEEILGVSVEDYGLFLNEAGTDYISVWDCGKLSVAEFQGNQVGYSPEMFTPENTPKPLCRYYVSAENGGFRLSAVLPDESAFQGTILAHHSLDLHQSGIPLSKEDFEDMKNGDEVSLYDYLANSNYIQDQSPFGFTL